MKYNNGNYFVDVKDKRYISHPGENIKLRLCDQPRSLRDQYQVQNQQKFRKNQKVFRTDNIEFIVKNYPETKKPSIEKPKNNLSFCLGCRRYNWTEYTHGYFRRTVECDIVTN